MRSRERKTYLPSILKESIVSITRNRFITIAAALSIIAALLILGIFIIFTANVNAMTEATENSLEIQLFLKEGVSQAQREELENILNENEDISEVYFESKSEALENFSEQLGEYSALADDINDSNNPLPESFIVTAVSSDKLPAIRDFAEEINEIEYVHYEENFLTALLSFTDFINIFSLVLLIVMSVIAMFLIYNVIRLTVSNRSQEIQIMKSLGATNFFIRTPFVLEGTFLGLVSAIFSILLICLIYFYFFGYINGSILLPFTDTILSARIIVLLIAGSFLAYGAIIGSLGAAFATRRFLIL